MHDLGTLGGAQSHANGINKFGQVVGWAWYSSTANVHAFLYTGGVMYDLNNLVQNLPEGAVLQTATGINDRGQIVANSTLGHAYLLTPAPMRSLYTPLDLLLLQ